MIINLRNSTLISKGHQTAEGPVWDPHRKVFFYVDIEGGTLHQYDPKDDHTTTWQIGSKENGQMIGGAIAVNKDGPLILILEAGPNAGVIYFKPETGQLINIPNSWPELDKPHNRPNDSTVIRINGVSRMVFGTISKAWKSGLEEGKKEGSFYILDDNLQPQKLLINEPYPGTVIGNGLVDGGPNLDGTTTLFWAETIGEISHAKIWKGKLSPTTSQVTDVKMFVDYLALTDGITAYPDGANMIMVDGQPAYAISILGIGEIRAFNPDTGELVAKIKLPQEIRNITKFVVGENRTGDSALFITTLNFDYPKGKEGLDGATFLMPLPNNISAHPASVQITQYALGDIELWLGI